MKCIYLLVAGLVMACNNTAEKRNGDVEVKSMVADYRLDSSNTIAKNILQSDDFSRFAELLKKAGLINTLEQPGPFTVFAPNDDAFSKLDAEKWNEILRNGKEELVNIAGYHIVPGSLVMADLKDGQKLKTVSGEELKINIRDKKIFVNGAAVIAADIKSGNGIIDVTAELLDPASPQ